MILIQNFAKINTEANHWAAAEVEWVDNEERSKKYGVRMVDVMNVYGALSIIPYKDLSFHFKSYYSFTSEPMVLQIRKSHLQNTLQHYVNTGESIIKHTLHIPVSWLSLQKAVNDYKSEIDKQLEILSLDKNIDRAYTELETLITSYKYRLGLIKVELV